MSFDEFQSLAALYTVVPVARTILADLHTPVSAYLALRTGGESFLFESAEPNEKIGRYSFIGISPEVMVIARGTSIEIRQGRESRSVSMSIFDLLQEIERQYSSPRHVNDGGLVGGLVGYIGYDCVSHLEHVTPHSRQYDGPPDAMVGLFTTVLRFDHRNHVITIVQNILVEPGVDLSVVYKEALKKIDTVELRLRNAVIPPGNFQARGFSGPTESDRQQYCEAVLCAKQYIVEGDIFQVVLSRTIETSFAGDPFSVYRALRTINPSPYLFYVDFGETRLIGSSPEVLVRVRSGEVEVFPIAGTRKRGTTTEEDLELEQDLIADTKELAEHVMLVDLGRNDVGRISEFGSVEVPIFQRIERYSHVMHIVSEVRGRLKKGTTSVDALKACFPAGTVSGAPKVRAMQIIRELEPVQRGAYAGAVGYLGFDGTLDTCIAIRTIVAYRDRLRVQAGAGIVADSIPENEFQETVNKAQVLVDAIALASEGLTLSPATSRLMSQ